MEHVCYVAYKDWFRDVEGDPSYDRGYSVLTGTNDLQICVNKLMEEYREDLMDKNLYATYGIQVYSNGLYRETLVLNEDTLEIKPVAFDVRKYLERSKEFRKNDLLSIMNDN